MGNILELQAANYDPGPVQIIETSYFSFAFFALPGHIAEGGTVRFVDQAWKLLADATNAARHEQSIGIYTAADGRAALLFTAVLLEYLADSLQRRM